MEDSRNAVAEGKGNITNTDWDGTQRSITAGGEATKTDLRTGEVLLRLLGVPRLFANTSTQ